MRKLSFEEFKNKAEKIHKAVYLYSGDDYVNTKIKITIFCTKGLHYFKQLPSTHLLGKGCKNCSLRKTKEQFLNEAISIFGNRFEYDLSNYETSTSKIEIKCNDCDFVFKAQANWHLLAKNGCKKCCLEQARTNIRKSFDSFLQKSIERNGDIFNFKIIEYPFNRKSKLEVNCIFCDNTFPSYANSILNKSGCPSCSHNSKHPDTEGFVYQLTYKNLPIPYIGITTTTLKTRLRRHIDDVKYKKNNTKLNLFLRDKDLKHLSIIELEKSKAILLADKENFWIEKNQTKYPNGLNINKGGSGLNLKYIK